jgi:hypothetical protein
MSHPQYIFGRTKVHPEPPVLDIKVAPWSAPRGYTTTLREEADVIKAAARARKPIVKVAGGRHTSKSHLNSIQTPNCLIKMKLHICQVFSDLATNLRGNSTKFVSTLFCLTAEVD